MAEQHLSADEAELVEFSAELCSSPRPEFTSHLLADELAALREKCSGKCLVTQSVAHVHGELVQVITACGSCGKHRTLDARPAEPMPQLA